MEVNFSRSNILFLLYFCGKKCLAEVLLIHAKKMAMYNFLILWLKNSSQTLLSQWELMGFAGRLLLKSWSSSFVNLDCIMAGLVGNYITCWPKLAWKLKVETYKLYVNCDQSYSYIYMSYNQKYIYLIYSLKLSLLKRYSITGWIIKKSLLLRIIKIEIFIFWVIC